MEIPEEIVSEQDSSVDRGAAQCLIASVTTIRPRQWWEPPNAQRSAVIMYDPEDGFVRDSTSWVVLAAAWETDARLDRQVRWYQLPDGRWDYHLEYHFNPNGA